MSILGLALAAYILAGTSFKIGLVPVLLGWLAIAVLEKFYKGA